MEIIGENNPREQIQRNILRGKSIISLVILKVLGAVERTDSV